MAQPDFERPTGQAQANSQYDRRSDMKQMTKGGREHTVPIQKNGAFFPLVQPVMKFCPNVRHRLSWLPGIATLRDFASEPALSPASHSLRNAAQCLHSICRPGGSR